MKVKEPRRPEVAMLSADHVVFTGPNLKNGVNRALETRPPLRRRVNVAGGRLTSAAVASSLDLPYVENDEIASIVVGSA